MSLVVFEVLSPFSLRRDMVHKTQFLHADRKPLALHRAWRRTGAKRPCSPRSQWIRVAQASAEGAIELPELGVSLPLADIYRDVVIG